MENIDCDTYNKIFMNEDIILPRWKYYILSIIIGSALNILLLGIALTTLGFSGKSLVALFYISVRGYFYKSVIFYLPFLFLNTDFSARSELQKNLIFFSPFLLFFTWFAFIILFQISSFFHEISYGYIGRFPHFYMQLIATLITCFLIRYRTNIRLREET
jgi:hypothetical protein